MPDNKNSDQGVAGDVAAGVDDAITSRRSARGFLPASVPRQTVEEIIAVAARAPSGTNMQPWRVTVVAGAAKEALSKAVLAAHDAEPEGQGREYAYYPKPMPEPYISRRRRIGWDLYGLVGIEKGDKAKMHAQHAKNFEFFGAPVGMIFTIEKVLEIGSWLDYGMFLQNIMVSARGRGLHTCPQAAWASYHRTVREQLDIPDTETVVCGMSLGHIDWSAPENALETVREPVEGFVKFIDFEE